jgi:pyruvate/2-oxoglutarate dehydrogenase complex dihydrolipoamide dehydrogenase (E3) component
LALEYDLVIIGATVAARSAAIEAANLQARVALVLPQSAVGSGYAHGDLYPYALAQIATNSRRDRSRQQLSSYPWKYAQLAIERIEQQSSPALLAAMGIDTIVGTGEFCRRPQFAFQVEDRYLQARSYLVASGSVSHYPTIPGIQHAGYLVRDRLPSLIDREIPFKWAIIGSEAIGVELAQTLAKLGCEVTLIVESAQILPYEHADLANYMQAQLEAEGVSIYLETTVTNVGQDGNLKLVQTGAETIAVDEIFIALPDRPLLEPFNLTGVGVEYRDEGISIDNRFRTSHPQIYACGSVCGNVLGGYHSHSLTRYEAQIAARNALSWRKTRVDYRSYNNLPWMVYTDPPLARVGMRVPDDRSDRDGYAIADDRRGFVVLKSYLKESVQGVLTNSTSGFCRMVVTRSGRILGAEIVAPTAADLIQIIAIAIQQKMTIASLNTFPCLSPSHTEFVYQAVQQWYKYRRDWQQQASWLDAAKQTLSDRLLCWK